MTTPSISGEFWHSLAREAIAADHLIREGRFQKGLALVAGVSGLLSGLEVAYEHYRGSYGQRIMYTPVIISTALLAAGIAGFANKRAARTVLPIVSGLTLADGLVGFIFHLRGIQRKPGGWRVLVTNIIMGPPIFAPLLFGIGGYLGLIATFLRREDVPDDDSVHPLLAPLRTLAEMHPGKVNNHDASIGMSWEQDLREGRFQKHMAAATALAAFFSGAEALYSHYKNNFSYKMQWSPIILAPMLMGASIGSIKSRRIAHTILPVVSLAAIANGAIGFFYHARGVLRRPGGMKLPLYNIMYGPPLFAPLLFSACGSLGLLASLLRREE